MDHSAISFSLCIGVWNTAAVCFAEPYLEIATDDDSVITAIYFQDSIMKTFFTDYPELLLLDATYKLTNVRMPLYVVLSVGPNGESAIVAVFLTAHEDTATSPGPVGWFAYMTLLEQNCIFSCCTWWDHCLYNTHRVHRGNMNPKLRWTRATKINHKLIYEVYLTPSLG